MRCAVYLHVLVCLSAVARGFCPSQCTCVFHGRTDGTGSRSVLCNDPDMSDIPVNVPVDTVKLRVEKTAVRRIPTEAFYYLVDLRYLWITYNSISSVDMASFYNLKVLHELRLDGNQISLFPWESLKEMPSLRTLDLHNNRLTTVPSEAISYLVNITYLDLNKLSTLPSDLMDIWPPFSKAPVSNSSQKIVLGLQDNPWFCDCKISKLIELSKMADSPVVLMDLFLTCTAPENLAGVLFQRAELENCVKPSVMTSATKITSPLGSNVVLRCDATASPHQHCPGSDPTELLSTTQYHCTERLAQAGQNQTRGNGKRLAADQKSSKQDPSKAVTDLQVVEETADSAVLLWTGDGLPGDTPLTVVYSPYGEEDSKQTLETSAGSGKELLQGLSPGMRYSVCLVAKGSVSGKDPCVDFYTLNTVDDSGQNQLFMIISGIACALILPLIALLLYKILALYCKGQQTPIDEEELEKESYVKFETISMKHRTLNSHPTELKEQQLHGSTAFSHLWPRQSDRQNGPGRQKAEAAGVRCGFFSRTRLRLRRGNRVLGRQTLGVIYKALPSSRKQKVFSSDKHISGLAVDWIWKHVYWSSREKGKIRRVDTNGKNQTVILRHLSQPSSVAVDPTKRFLFWLTDGPSSGIQRANLTGHVKTTILKIHGRLQALTVDYKDKRLFWLQSDQHHQRSAVGSCDYNGKVVHITDHQLRSFSLSISMFMNNLYYNDFESRSIKRVHKYGGESRKVNRKTLAKPPVGVKVVQKQPKEESAVRFSDVNECAHWNHGCSLGCENVPGSYFCTCPKGYTLLPDKKTCQEIVECDSGRQCGSGCLQVENSLVCVCPEGSVLQEDGQACTGPPPLLLVATLVDVRKLRPDGTGEEVLLSETRGESQHWTMTQSTRIQSTIESSLLTGQKRETFISYRLQKPKAIVVHALIRRLFWTDVGSRPVVESVSLDGSGRVLVASTNLVSPSGLCIDFPEERLWWCDSGTGLVESTRLDGSQRRLLSENQVGRAFGVAVWEELLWVSEQEHHQLRSFHKRTGKELQRLHSNMVQPANIMVLHPVAKPGADVCLHKNGGCAQLCESKHGEAVCSCLPSSVLSADGSSCLQRETHSSTTESVGSDSSTGTTSSLSDKMVADERECSWLHCDDNAQCVQTAEGSVCVCREGFTGDGHFGCSETAAATLPPVVSNMIPGQHNNNVAEKCPSSHESYCLYQGVCFYFPQMKSYACNCVPGYMGERCQFSDLEWWELQQAEENKRRNKSEDVCKKRPDDSMSETSGTVESMSDATSSSVPPFSLTADGVMLPVTICPRRAACPSCSSELGEPDDSGASAQHNPGYECSMLSAVAMETDLLSNCQSNLVSTFTTFKPQQLPQSPQPPAEL
ncbi:hypothetical protein WMY93_009121 [Mugilogobius chulae]|uniref:Uncharacterized protein n=1 Tax=Mugilogobius chulae TaxID=88201 RepID=A0AAW0PAM0_9GOBI